MQSLGITLEAYDHPKANEHAGQRNLTRLLTATRRHYTAKMNTPQQLSRLAIDEFKAIYKDEFGQELSDDEAQEIAMRLLRFFGILAKPGDTQK